MGLGLGTLGITVFLVVKVAQREYRKPSSLIRAHTMGEHERRSQLIFVSAWDHVHHASGMSYCVIPEGAGHLFFGEVGTRHVHHNFPVGFDEAIRGLATGRAGDDGRGLKMEEGPDMAAKQFLVAVTPKVTGEVAGLRAEGQEGGNYVVVMERFEAETPIVACSTINKNHSIFVTSNRHAVAKGNINVDNVEIFGGCPIDGFTAGGFGNGSESTDGGGKFTVINEQAILGGVDEMPVVAETTASSDAM